MADKRFYFWESYAKAFDMLSDEDAGRFIKACSAFAFRGEAPDFSDSPMLGLSWEFVRGQIETSVGIGIQRSENGKKGGRPSKKSSAKSSAKTTALSSAESSAESDMNLKVNVSAGASLEGSAPALEKDGGESDEY